MMLLLMRFISRARKWKCGVVSMQDVMMPSRPQNVERSEAESVAKVARCAMTRQSAPELATVETSIVRPSRVSTLYVISCRPMMSSPRAGSRRMMESPRAATMCVESL